MRVLIIAAFFACAAAAPSTFVAPLIYQPSVIPAAVPTISPGDIQGAAVEAQAKLNDLARAAVDQANTNVDFVNEKNVEAFWSSEDKKWQAVDSLKTAEAVVDGAVASNADAYAKAAVGGVVPAPIPYSYSPVVYSPYITAVNSVLTPTVEAKVEESKDEKQEAVAKTEETAAQAVAETATKQETVTEKAAEQPVVFANTLVTPYSSLYNYGVPASVVSNFVAQPYVNYAPYQPVQNILTPTYLRNFW